MVKSRVSTTAGCERTKCSGVVQLGEGVRMTCLLKEFEISGKSFRFGAFERLDDVVLNRHQC